MYYIFVLFFVFAFFAVVWEIGDLSSKVQALTDKQRIAEQKIARIEQAIEELRRG